MKKLRIAHITTAHPKKDGRIFYRMCRSTAAMGHDTHLVCLSNADTTEVIDQVQIQQILIKNTRRFYRASFGLIALYKAISKLKPNIIHVHEPELLLLALLCRFKKIKVLYDAHEDLTIDLQTKKWLPTLLRKPIATVAGIVESLLTKFTQAIVVAADGMKKRFPKATVLHNYPIVEDFEQINYKQRPNVTAYFGVLQPDRNIINMLEAIKKTPLNLRIAGNAPNPEIHESVQQFCETGQGENLGFIDYPQVCKELSNTKIGLLLYTHSQHFQPTKMYEYMAAGLPIVASSFPAWKDFVEQQEIGICVDPTDIDTIVLAITTLLNDPQKAQAMGEKGRRFISEHYAWEKESEKLAKVYADLA